MILPEVILLLLVAGIVGVTIPATIYRILRSRAAESGIRSAMESDLRRALESGDYRQLDNWIVLYSNYSNDTTVQLVKVRRDEMYVEANDHG